MKTSEKRGFGAVGITVELSFIELIVISQLAESLNFWHTELTESAKNRISDSQLDIADKIRKASALLSKLSKPGSIQDVENDLFSEPVSPLMSDEDLKNECDLNALENETHQ